MSVPLFHENNSFHIYKNNQELKTINFRGHKVGLYYKLYSILRKKHNYHLRTATVMTLTNRILMQGSFYDIFNALIEELRTEHKYTIVSVNSEGGEVHHWRDDLDGVLLQLNTLKEGYTRSGDERLFSSHIVMNNEKDETFHGNLDYLIDIFEHNNAVQNVQEADVQEAEFGVYLSFEEVLNDMRPLIMNGTDKEKIEAKAILAYVATKLAGK